MAKRSSRGFFAKCHGISGILELFSNWKSHGISSRAGGPAGPWAWYPRLIPLRGLLIRAVHFGFDGHERFGRSLAAGASADRPAR
jgi:hypothetical protein